MANRSVKLKSGRILDHKLIDKLSSEADRGYDLSKAERLVLRPGRPARGEAGGESPRVASRVPGLVYRAAKERAKGNGLTVSEVVRTLLTEYAAGRSLPTAAKRAGAMRIARASVSGLTATPANKGVRRRTISGTQRGKPSTRRAPANVQGQRKTAL